MNEMFEMAGIDVTVRGLRWVIFIHNGAMLGEHVQLADFGHSKL